MGVILTPSCRGGSIYTSVESERVHRFKGEHVLFLTNKLKYLAVIFFKQMDWNILGNAKGLIFYCLLESQVIK